MLRFRYVHTFALAGILCAMAGCDRPSASSVPAAPEAAAKPEASTPNEDAGHGAGYTFHVRYPQLPSEWSALAQALRAYADARKQELLDARASAEIADGPAYNLDLEFNIARRTSAFVSILANGSSWTGGAHPAPLVASFNLHTDDGKLVTLADMFSDANAALGALSAESRRQLGGRLEARLRETVPEKEQAAALKDMREWVERGTDAKAENFAVFLVDGLEARAIGLTLIFPPYQVAAYVEGPQQIEVPAKVFYSLLKPEYRDAFQIDTEAEKLAPGVR